MIQRIGLTNFKAFQNAELALKPITILLGPNNSGKSSVLAALKILSQTFESNDMDIPILLNGIMGDFGTYKDLVHQNILKDNITLFFKILKTKRQSFRNYNLSDKNYISISITLSYRPKIKEIIIKHFTVWDGDKHVFTTDFQFHNESYKFTKLFEVQVPPNVRLKYKRFKMNYLPYFFLDTFNQTNNSINFLKENNIFEHVKHLDFLSYPDDIRSTFSSVDHIGAMRVPPARSYLFTGEKRSRIGSSGQHALSLLALDALRSASKTKNIREKVVKWLKKAQMASDIKVITSQSGRHFELYIENFFSKEIENYADVGYGQSQVIPVLIGGYNLKPNSTYIVEEPEIHLHPRAQSELGDFFVELYNNGIHSILETHSEHLIIRLQQHIACGHLTNEDIIFYYIRSTDEGKVIDQINFDETGLFTTEWPEGFFPERLKEAKKLASIRYNIEVK